MAWAGGVWDSTYGTSTGSISMGMQIYYDKKFLKRAKDNLFMWELAQKRPIPEGGGKQIRFFRYHDIDTLTSALTEGTNPDPTAVTGAEVNRNLEEWGAFSQHSSLVSRTHIDKGLAKVSELWGDNAGRTVDLRTMKEVVANGAHSMRATNDASGTGMRSGQWTGTATGTTHTTTVTYVADGSLDGGNADQTNDFWIGGQMTWTKGANYGQSRVITDSDGTAKSLTVTLPWENAPTNGDTFILSHPGKSGAIGSVAADALGSTEVLTHKTFTKAWEDLKVQRAMPFSGGYYAFVIGPTTHAEFMSDATFIGLEQYQPSDKSKLVAGEIGKYMGFKIITTTQPFRCTLPTTTTSGGPGQSSTTYVTSGSNYSATGSGHYSLALGQEAYGVTSFPGWKQPKIIVKTPGPSDTGNPLNRFSTVGWELPFVPCALNGLWATTVVSGG